MLDLRRLRLLHELMHHGTVMAVAEALSFSPSTVSQQLAVLEREAGTTLLVQVGRRLQLTPAGRQLAVAAGEMLALEEQARSALGGSDPGPGPVRVAVFQTATHAVIPRALTWIAHTAPQLRVEIAEVPPEDGLAGVVTRRFDIAVAEQYPGHAREQHHGLDRIPLGNDRIRIGQPPEAPTTPLRELRDAHWVMEPVGTAARMWAVQQCRAEGFEPDVRFETADLVAHVRLVAAGHAVGMLPDLLWGGLEPPVQLSTWPGDPDRDIFTSARTSSRDRADIRVVREALAASIGSSGEDPTSVAELF